MRKNILFLAVLLLSTVAFGQNKNVGINTNNPDPTAVLHLESTTQGLLVPRLTTPERDAIAGPATGLIIYNTTEDQEEIYNGTCWIPSYLKECDDCQLDIDFAQPNYAIDRVNTMNIQVPVTITQGTLTGAVLPVELAMVHTFSDETEISLSQYNLNGSGVVNIDINTNVFERGGDHFVTIFASCDETAIAKTVQITIAPCDQVVINSDQTNYDLSANGVTGNNCVVVTIDENVGIRSADPTIPAFTTGAINPACNMGIINNGYVFGRGGDGPLLMGINGEDGGTAMELQCNAEIRNNGMIYGGGGSGLTVGAFQPIDLGPFTICLAIGAGGGGGMPDGLGGGDVIGTCTTVIGLWEEGDDAGPNYDDDEGQMVSESIDQGFSLGPVNGSIAITANSGAGGDFGEPGTGNPQPVDFTGSYLEICINIPFIGESCIPVPGLSAALNALANLINNAFNTSVPGIGGYAIQHAAGCSIPDDNYQTYRVRGVVGN